MLETVLMRTFLMFYVGDFERDDDNPAVILGRSRSAERQAFTRLCSVCWSWHQTLTGWTESPTSHWVRHQLKKLIEREYAHLTKLTWARYFATAPGPAKSFTQHLTTPSAHPLTRYWLPWALKTIVIMTTSAESDTQSSVLRTRG